jgi:hypothetical protein
MYRLRQRPFISLACRDSAHAPGVLSVNLSFTDQMHLCDRLAGRRSCRNAYLCIQGGYQLSVVGGLLGVMGTSAGMANSGSAAGPFPVSADRQQTAPCLTRQRLRMSKVTTCRPPTTYRARSPGQMAHRRTAAMVRTPQRQSACSPSSRQQPIRQLCWLRSTGSPGRTPCSAPLSASAQFQRWLW